MEPSAFCPDVSLFDFVTTFPCRVVFWRAALGVSVLHRNPLFDDRLGVSVDRICVDDLHTMKLGVYQRYALHCVWALIDVDAWGVGYGRSKAELALLSCERMRGELTAYYAELKAADHTRDITEIPHFSLSKLGGPNHRTVLRTKGAETKWFLGYVVQALREHGNRISCQHALVEAGQHLLAYEEMMSTAPRRLAPGQVVDMFSHMKGFVALAEHAGIPPIPKFHLWAHMCARTRVMYVRLHSLVKAPGKLICVFVVVELLYIYRSARQGNPLFTATWKDEALKTVLAEIARSVSFAHFEARVLLRFRAERCGVLPAARKRKLHSH